MELFLKIILMYNLTIVKTMLPELFYTILLIKVDTEKGKNCAYSLLKFNVYAERTVKIIY